jgi:hypothetical protein
VRYDISERLRERLSAIGLDQLRAEAIERVEERLNASWSYVDVVAWTFAITPTETPVLFFLSIDLDQSHKNHKLIGEEHNLSGLHFHYTNLEGRRSDILFAFGRDPVDPQYPIKWERHATGKAKFRPTVERWNDRKRININSVCCSARNKMAPKTRFYQPSKESQYLYP